MRSHKICLCCMMRKRSELVFEAEPCFSESLRTKIASYRLVDVHLLAGNQKRICRKYVTKEGQMFQNHHDLVMIRAISNRLCFAIGLSASHLFVSPNSLLSRCAAHFQATKTRQVLEASQKDGVVKVDYTILPAKCVVCTLSSSHSCSITTRTEIQTREEQSVYLLGTHRSYQSSS